jgi:hypothetical protein
MPCDPDTALNVPFCFCTVCNHDPKYGYCWFCRCQNHVEVQPELDEEGKKLLQALRRAKELLTKLKAQKEEK